MIRILTLLFQEYREKCADKYSIRFSICFGTKPVGTERKEGDCFISRAFKALKVAGQPV